MKLLLLALTFLPLLSKPFWPELWWSGLSSGWVSAMALELLTHFRRQRAFEPDAPPQAWLSAIVGGFLAKLVVLLAVAVVGARFSTHHVPAFLFSFLAAMALGEALSLTALARLPRLVANETDSPTPRSS